MFNNFCKNLSAAVQALAYATVAVVLATTALVLATPTLGVAALLLYPAAKAMDKAIEKAFGDKVPDKDLDAGYSSPSRRM
jgi:hypothetical protein